MTIRNLDFLLKPKSVALIGASSRAGSVGLTVARNLLAGGFGGRIDFVNPRHSEIEGHACRATIGDLAEPPDLAVIVTPAATVPSVIAELAAAGAVALGAWARAAPEIPNPSRTKPRPKKREKKAW